MNLIEKSLEAIKNGNFFERVFRYLFLTRKMMKLYFPFAKNLKVKNNKIVLTSYYGKSFACNPKFIMLQLYELYGNQFDYVWLCDFEYTNKSVIPCYVRLVNIYSFKGLKELATAKIWIDNCRKSVYVPKKKGQFYFQVWHGNLGPKLCEGDAIDFLSKKYIDMAKNDGKLSDYCISSGKHSYRLYKDSFFFNGEILNYGSARNDILFDLQKRDKLKKNLNLENKKICLYAPTFRNDYSLDNYTLDFSRLKQSLQKKFDDEWIILVRLHPNLLDKYDQFSSFFVNGIQNFTDYPDCQELLCISDCVISDYSSIVYDFCLTKRPVFIYAPDYENYIKNERNLYFTLESTPFSVSLNNDDLEKNILSFNNEKYLKEYENFKNRLEIYEPGNACQKIAELIGELCGIPNIIQGGTLKE